MWPETEVHKERDLSLKSFGPAWCLGTLVVNLFVFLIMLSIVAARI